MQPLLITLTEKSIPGGVEVFAQSLRNTFPSLQIVGRETLSGFSTSHHVPFAGEIQQGLSAAKYVESLSSPPDFVITSGLHGWALPSLSKKIPTVSFLHGTYAGLADAGYSPFSPLFWRMRFLLSHFENKSARQAHRVVVNSSFTQEEAYSYYGLNYSSIVELPINTNVFYPSSPSRARQKMGWAPEKNTVLFVGNPTHSKGFDVVEALAQKHPGIDFHAVISSQYISSIPNLHTHSAQPHEKLVDFYRAADVVLFPSRYEGFGFVPMEALACGTPVLSSRVGIFNHFSPTGAEIIPHALESFDRALTKWSFSTPPRSTFSSIKKRFSFSTFSQLMKKEVVLAQERAQ
ncbi:MAG: glycosyltransferase family 4 protein [archaeon]